MVTRLAFLFVFLSLVSQTDAQDRQDHESKFISSITDTFKELQELHQALKESKCRIPVSSQPVPAEASMNASQLITSKGYPCENHDVITNDGYILGVQRISHGLKESPGPRPVVFLQHGLGTSSTNWITNSASESLAFVLADAGYDVWLGNMRGNTYSRKHVKYSPDQREFWKFSFDHMAKYDLPALIKYALKQSNQTQLSYVGHSQGTLIGFAQFGRDTDLAKLVKTFYALAPVTTVANVKSPIRLLAKVAKQMKFFSELFGVGEFLPNSPVMKWFAKYICGSTFLNAICQNVVFLFAGYDCHNLNASRLPVYLSHTPAGTSVQNILHFSQLIKSGNFQMYDYGSRTENMKHYNSDTPPFYDASLMKTPVVIYSGGKDWLSDPADVRLLIPKLQNMVKHKYIHDYNHLDFIWGMNARAMIYDDIVNHLKAN